MDKKEKQNRIKELLENSFLPKEIKAIVTKNLNKYDDKVLDGVLDSLSKEKVRLEKVAAELMKFDAESQSRWDDLEIDQLKAADDFIDSAFKDLIA